MHIFKSKLIFLYFFTEINLLLNNKQHRKKMKNVLINIIHLNNKKDLVIILISMRLLYYLPKIILYFLFVL
jgi:hypothetical protein